jgi:multiple sugar transport system substrate-binding protein
LVNKGLLLDTTDYIAKSKVLTFDDISEACKDSVIVNGRYYGLPHDWATPEFAALYIYNTAFERAGIPIPSTTKPLTYAELGDIARKLSAQSGRPAYYSFSLERVISAILSQRNTRLFNADGTQMQLTNNPQAMETLRYFYDLAMAGAIYPTPQDPHVAYSFFDATLPIIQFGYWHGALVQPTTKVYGDVTVKPTVYGKVTMLPPPVWDRNLPRTGSTAGGAKHVIAANTKHPAEAYRFIEWFVAGPPAIERTSAGWGLPTLRSYGKFLPRKTAFDRQRLAVTEETLKHPYSPLPAYPYLKTIPALNKSWVRNIELAKAGKMKFEQLASNIQQEVNLAILNEIREDRNRAAKANKATNQGR